MKIKFITIRYIEFISTRHSFSTLMLENGEDIVWVSTILGHTDSTMTLSKYVHYIKREDKKRAEFLNKELALSDTNILKVA